MRYLVFVRGTRTGYSADVPDLPGCVATGSTVEHIRQMIAEAIDLHLDLMRQGGESIPLPSHQVAFAVDDDSAEEFRTWVEIEAPAVGML